MDQHQTLRHALDLSKKLDFVGSIRLLAAFEAATQARHPMHVVVMAQMLAGLFHMFRTIVESGAAAEKISEVYYATYGCDQRWSDMYEMLLGTYRFRTPDEMATWIVEKIEHDPAVHNYVETVNPYLPAYIALMMGAQNSERAQYELVDASFPLVQRLTDGTRYGSSTGLLRAWGSHSLALGLLHCLRLSGIPIQGRDVLDLGCGSGLLSWYLPQPRTLTGIDIDPVMLELAAAREASYTSLHQHDARTGTLFTRHDLIVSSGVFQYFRASEYGDVLAFCAENLVEGGYLSFVAPGCSNEREEIVFNVNQHAVSDKVVAELAAATGFEIIDCRFTPAIGAHRFRLLRKL